LSNLQLQLRWLLVQDLSSGRHGLTLTLFVLFCIWSSFECVESFCSIFTAQWPSGLGLWFSRISLQSPNYADSCCGCSSASGLEKSRLVFGCPKAQTDFFSGNGWSGTQEIRTLENLKI
jgi:hypothetical protein